MSQGDAQKLAIMNARVLITIDGGGFLWQSLSVVRALEPQFHIHLVSILNP